MASPLSREASKETDLPTKRDAQDTEDSQGNRASHQERRTGHWRQPREMVPVLISTLGGEQWQIVASPGKQNPHFSSFPLLHLPSGPSRPADKCLILVDSSYSVPGSYKQVIYMYIYIYTHTQKVQYLCICVYISTYFIAIVYSLSHIRPFCNPMNCKLDWSYLLHFADKESSDSWGPVVCMSQSQEEAWRRGQVLPGLCSFTHSPQYALEH